MQNYLIKKFVKNYDNPNNPKTRKSYGVLVALIGLLTNTVLCLIKLIGGVITSSIATIADAINNLSDASTSLITLIGFKASSKERDAEHPYGHGRYEYISALIVVIFIIIVGILLLHTSYKNIINPSELKFSIPMLLFLLLSILVKIWLSSLNTNVGKKINSNALKATAIDYRNDVLATSAVLMSLIVFQVFDINIDGYIGALVALFILYSGFQLLKETLDPLIGTAPDPELVKEITEYITSKNGVLGIHDLIIHDYGPGRVFATAHAEVDAAENIIVSHNIIDDIERELQEKLNIELVIHMDPVDLQDPKLHQLRKLLSKEIENFDSITNLHDIRTVNCSNHTNVLFDLMIRPDASNQINSLRKHFTKFVTSIDKNYQCSITFDIDFSNKK